MMREKDTLVWLDQGAGLVNGQDLESVPRLALLSLVKHNKCDCDAIIEYCFFSFWSLEMFLTLEC